MFNRVSDVFRRCTHSMFLALAATPVGAPDAGRFGPFPLALFSVGRVMAACLAVPNSLTRTV